MCAAIAARTTARIAKRYGHLSMTDIGEDGDTRTSRGGDAAHLARFEAEVLPHLDAAYAFARHLMRDPSDAEDAAHDAILRAVRHFSGFRGTNARAWLLAIVRNTCFTALRKRRALVADEEFDEMRHGLPAEDDPETALMRGFTHEDVRRAMDELPVTFREVLVLRELEGYSYQQIAEISAVPVGTVMSRLSRARGRLQQRLNARDRDPEEAS